MRAAAIVLAVAAVLAAAVTTAGCSAGNVVTTGEAPPSTQSSAPAAPPSPTRETNDGLANAFDFAAQPDGHTGYYFTSPSSRWVCAIIPREKVGCQSSSGTSIPITGAPDSVPDGAGDTSAPNAIQVARDGDPEFASLDPPEFALKPGPATVLPFGKVLIAAGFRCNVQEATGISCMSELTGKGFTFTSDGYTFAYTDLPG